MAHRQMDDLVEVVIGSLASTYSATFSIQKLPRMFFRKPFTGGVVKVELQF